MTPDGQIRFPDEFYKDNEYRSVFAPCVQQSRMVRIDNTGLSGGLRRLLNCRKPEVPLFHETLVENQKNYYTAPNRALQLWQEHFRGVLRRLLPGPEVTREQLVKEWAYEPNPKKKLRVATYEQVDRERRWGTYPAKRITRIAAKPGELLEGPSANEKGAFLRMIGDLGTEKAMRVAYMCKWLKAAAAEEFTIWGCKCVFIPAPRKSLIGQWFEKLWSGMYKVCFIFFSDDSCISIRCTDGVYVANVDISKCDSSHYKHFFAFVKATIDIDSRYSGDIEEMYGQLKNRCKVYSRTNRRHQVVMQPQEEVMPSGWAGTTFTNNCASTTGIFLPIVLAVRDARGRLRIRDCKDLVETATQSAGYIVKCFRCHIIEDLQFLKHSCVRRPDGTLAVYVNWGAYLRGFGTFKGELPGSRVNGRKATLLERAEAFISDVVVGRRTWGRHPLSIAMEHFTYKNHKNILKYSRDNRYRSNVDDLTSKTDAEDHGFIPCDLICKRYRCNPEQLQDLCDHIQIWRVGQLLVHPLVYVILQVDYGYPTDALESESWPLDP